MDEAADEIEELTRRMSESVVDYPDEVRVEAACVGEMLTMEVHCRDSDRGSLIGTRGRIADAMRIVLSSAAAARGIKVHVLFAPSRQA